MRRRILEKLRIDEISGVDNPAQAHAKVTIMKRHVEKQDDSEPLARFNMAVNELAEKEALTLDAARRRMMAKDPEGYRAWEAAQTERAQKRAEEIMKAEGCPAVVAVTKAWVEIEGAERANDPTIQKRTDEQAVVKESDDLLMKRALEGRREGETREQAFDRYIQEHPAEYAVNDLLRRAVVQRATCAG